MYDLVDDGYLKCYGFSCIASKTYSYEAVDTLTVFVAACVF